MNEHEDVPYHGFCMDQIPSRFLRLLVSDSSSSILSSSHEKWRRQLGRDGVLHDHPFVPRGNRRRRRRKWHQTEVGGQPAMDKGSTHISGRPTNIQTAGSATLLHCGCTIYKNAFGC